MFWIWHSEGVDTLCIIAHHANILCTAASLLKDHVLGKVYPGLINQYIFKLSWYLCNSSGWSPQQYIHVEKQVVEIHA